jgi:hypothetical protein
MSKSNDFEELANKYIKSNSLILDNNDKIASVVIKLNDETYKKITNFMSYLDTFSPIHEQSILLDKIKIYNMYISAAKSCEQIATKAHEESLALKEVLEKKTNQSGSNEHGVCKIILDLKQ